MRKRDVRRFLINEGLFIAMLFLLGATRIWFGKNPFGDNIYHNVGLVSSIRILTAILISPVNDFVDSIKIEWDRLED